MPLPILFDIPTHTELRDISTRIVNEAPREDVKVRAPRVRIRGGVRRSRALGSPLSAKRHVSRAGGAKVLSQRHVVYRRTIRSIPVKSPAEGDIADPRVPGEVSGNACRRTRIGVEVLGDGSVKRGNRD